ncbi:MAG: hypothetical protein HOF21_00225 [Nitrospina sp.]|jgi:hypothetical protein|nr:hypothetical protein [Nitrospina sp.]MBT5632707.1 hypothetical protein [Nitrospina sp.]
MKKVISLTKYPVFLFTLILLAIPFSNPGEASNPVSVTTRITPNTFTLGDIATYIISVQHDPDIQPVAPEVIPPKGLEFVDKGKSPSKELNGQTVQEYWYKFRVDDIGIITFPSISVTFDAQDQNQKIIQGTIMAPEASLEVQSLVKIQGNAEGIHDIKPLEEISPPWTHYFWIALGVLALIALLYFIWHKWKSRPTKLANSPSIPALTPEQLAYKELEALRVKGWIQIGRTQDHFFELSEIFRRYLENRFQFPAREWTTEEITAHFKHFSGLNENLKLQARSILTQTDRIKFAKAEVAGGQDEIKSIINFIREACPTKPASQVSK